jgi:hypothetical protein
MHLDCLGYAAILAVLAFGLGHYLGYRAANVEVFERLKRIADKQVQP